VEKRGDIFKAPDRGVFEEQMAAVKLVRVAVIVGKDNKGDNRQKRYLEKNRGKNAE